MATSLPHSYRTLTTTNIVPNAHEAAVVLQQVQCLEYQHRQLLLLLSQTQSRIQDVASQLNLLRPVVSSMRRLPLEVLGEIFLHVTPTSKTRPNSYQKALTKLTLVCKRWRDAAYLTPRLWCNIWVRVDAPSLSYEHIVAWIGRTGCLPRSIEISLSNCGGVNWRNKQSGHGGVDTDICAGSRCLFANNIIVKLLQKTPGAWNSVTLKPPTPNCLRKLVTALERTEASSENVAWNSIRSFDLIASDFRRWLAHEGHDRRLLSDLSFIPSSITSLSLALPFPYASNVVNGSGVWNQDLRIAPAILNQLNSLHLEFNAVEVDSFSLFDTLRHCKNLQHLVIDFAGSFVNDDGLREFEADGLILPKVQHAHFLQLHRESMWALHLLRMPIIRELHLSFGRDGTRGDPEYGVTTFSLSQIDSQEDDEIQDALVLYAFIRGQQDSPSQLQYLHLKGLKFCDDVLFDILARLKSLVHLRLEWTQIYSSNTDFLSLEISKPPRLPKLKVLEILNHRTLGGYEVPHLRSFADSRGIDLTVSYDWPYTSRRNDVKRYSTLIDLPSESEGED